MKFKKETTTKEGGNQPQKILEWGLTNVEALGEIYKQQTKDEKSTYETIIIYLDKARTQGISAFLSRVKPTKNNPFKFNIGFDPSADVYIREKTDKGEIEKQKVTFLEFKKTLESEKWPPIKFFNN